jgi:signal transduction histidine kinase
MNVSFERRAMILSTVAVAGTLTVLVAALALALYSVYVRGVGVQLNDSLEEIRAYVGLHGAPGRADDLAHAVASRLVRPQAVVIVLDPQRRAEVRWSRAQDALNRSTATVALSARTQVRISTPNGVPAQLLVGLATLFGLAPVQAQFGQVSVVVRPSDTELTAAVGPFVPWFIVAEIAALVLGVALARFLTRQALRPLAEVTAALERFAAGDLTPQPVGRDGRQRLDALAKAYNGAIDQVARAFAERDRAQAGMRQFIADAGHQLRTPLTVIRGFTAILRRGDLRETGDYMRILDAMNRQSLAMGSLIDKLIMLERWESGQVPAVAEAIDIAQLVEDVVAPIGEAHPQRVTFEVKTAREAAIDPSDLAQAVTNLVDNALKYTRGAVAIRVFESGATVMVEVADEGPGMNADEAARAFERFYRGPKRDVEGSGLGLSIARRAIERARGTLTVDTAPERGSRFTIGLPAVPSRRNATLPRTPASV